jgi:serine/threonine protein kinase
MKLQAEPTESEWIWISAFAMQLKGLPEGQQKSRMDGLAPELKHLKPLIEKYRKLSLDLDRNRTEEKIGDYSLVARIGEGGMGEVYQAIETTAVYERNVAIKLIRWPPTPSPSETTERVSRFKAEVEKLSKQPPCNNVVNLYKADIYKYHSGEIVPYLAMQYIHGSRSLKTYVQEAELEPAEILRLMTKVCRGIQHIHSSDIIHCDLKPENILVDSDANPRVTDFGIAKWVGDAVPRGQDGMGEGTRAYMSPEQVTDTYGEISKKSDVYALGVILYELLTNKLPHEMPIDGSPDERLKEFRRRILEEEPAKLDSIKRLYNGQVEVILNKALEKLPEKRFNSVEALKKAIERVLRKKRCSKYLAAKYKITYEEDVRVLVEQIAQWNGSTASNALDDYKKKLDVIIKNSEGTEVCNWATTIYASFLIKACMTSTDGAKMFWRETEVGLIFGRLKNLTASDSRLWRSASNYLLGRITGEFAAGQDHRSNPTPRQIHDNLQRRSSYIKQSLAFYDKVDTVCYSHFPLLLPGIKSECDESVWSKDYIGHGDPLINQVPIPYRYRAARRTDYAWVLLSMGSVLNTQDIDFQLQQAKADVRKGMAVAQGSEFMRLNLLGADAILEIMRPRALSKRRNNPKRTLDQLISDLASKHPFYEIPWNKRKEWTAAWCAAIASMEKNEKNAKKHLDIMRECILDYGNEYGHYSFAKVDAAYQLLMKKPFGLDCLNSIMQEVEQNTRNR